MWKKLFPPTAALDAMCLRKTKTQRAKASSSYSQRSSEKLQRLHLSLNNSCWANARAEKNINITTVKGLGRNVLRFSSEKLLNFEICALRYFETRITMRIIGKKGQEKSFPGLSSVLISRCPLHTWL
jgi:hypothetical protein